MTKTLLKEIEAERQRQITVEGWTPDHDDAHSDGELLSAATFYYLNAVGRSLTFREDGAPYGWRWDTKWWKPKQPHRDLVRAGAFCLAERDRLRRTRQRVGHVNQKLALIITALEATALLPHDGEKP